MGGDAVAAGAWHGGVVVSVDVVEPEKLER